MLLSEVPWSMEGVLVTKSIRLTEEEAEAVSDYLGLVGGTEAALLKEAALRGLRDIRLSQGILAYLEGAPPEEAARVAGLPRAPFLRSLADRGVTLLRGPSTIAQELEAIQAAEVAEGFDDDASGRADALASQP